MATKRTNPRRDFSQVALDVMRQATGEVPAPTLSKKEENGRKVVAKPAPTKKARAVR